MGKSTLKIRLAAALAATLIVSAPALADRTAAARRAQQQLAAVRSRIAAIASRRGAELARRDALAAQVRAADLEITAKRRALDALRAAAAAAARRLAVIESEKTRAEKSLDAERSRLAGQIVAAYMIGPREQIKLLLNQDHAADVGRMLAYYGYFGRARAAQINAIRDRLQRMAALDRDAREQSAHLRTLEDDANKELASLDQARQQRAAALTAVARRVQSSDQKLGALRREEHSVESLLEDLARVEREFPSEPQKNFAALRGRLPWPVAGRLVERFNDVRMSAAQGVLRWNGLLIRTAPGAKVRAPYFGRVVYADWLQGLGLLMIISHGGGYMSLYGHAEVLYKSVGDLVAPGDVIAAMGQGSTPAPRLYFGLRHGRTPLDPQPWLKGSP